MAAPGAAPARTAVHGRRASLPGAPPPQSPQAVRHDHRAGGVEPLPLVATPAVGLFPPQELGYVALPGLLQELDGLPDGFRAPFLASLPDTLPDTFLAPYLMTLLAPYLMTLLTPFLMPFQAPLLASFLHGPLAIEFQQQRCASHDSSLHGDH